MNSFTSSFKSELKVVAAVLVGLLTVELGFGPLLPHLSLDLKHVLALPNIAERLQKAPHPRILCIGNSLTRAGIDPETLQESLEEAGIRDAGLAVAYPDASGINEWFFALRKYFLDPRGIPDLVVVITARDHLTDRPLALSRNSAYYCNGSDFRDVLFHELGSMDARTEFVLARYLKSYANRGRVQPRVFSRMIPRYQEFLLAQEQGKFKRRPEPGRPAPPDPDPRDPEFQRFESLLELGRDYGFEIAVFTAPMMKTYHLPSGALELIREKGAALVEGSALPGIGPENLPDGSHLDAEGAKVFSKRLGTELARLLLKKREA